MCINSIRYNLQSKFEIQLDTDNQLPVVELFLRFLFKKLPAFLAENYSRRSHAIPLILREIS